MECNKQIVNTALSRSLNCVVMYIFELLTSGASSKNLGGGVHLGRCVYSVEYGITLTVMFACLSPFLTYFHIFSSLFFSLDFHRR